VLHIWFLLCEKDFGIPAPLFYSIATIISRISVSKGGKWAKYTNDGGLFLMFHTYPQGEILFSQKIKKSVPKSGFYAIIISVG
jgi:hypothetical protein